MAFGRLRRICLHELFPEDEMVCTRTHYNGSWASNLDLFVVELPVAMKRSRRKGSNPHKNKKNLSIMIKHIYFFKLIKNVLNFLFIIKQQLFVQVFTKSSVRVYYCHFLLLTISFCGITAFYQILLSFFIGIIK